MTSAAFASMTRVVRTRQAILFPVLDVLLNLFNWGFHVIVSRFLLPRPYGQLNSLLSLLSLLMVVGVGLQILTARQVAAHGIEQIPIFQRLALYLSGTICAVCLLALPFLSWLTRSNAVCIVLVLVIFAANTSLSVRRGLRQGKTTYLSLNGSFYLEVLVKLLASFTLLSIWPRPEAALTAIAIGMVVALIAAKSPVQTPAPLVTGANVALRPWFSRLWPIILASFFLYFFSSIDMLMVNRLLPDSAGSYAVISKYGQILFFAALSVGTVFIPQLSRARDNSLLFKKLTLRLVSILGVFNLTALLASWTFLPLTVQPVFGSSYVMAAPLLPLSILAYGLLAWSFCLVNVMVVIEHRLYLPVLLLHAIALMPALAIFHTDLTEVLRVLSVVYTLLLCCLAVLVSKSIKEISNAAIA